MIVYSQRYLDHDLQGHPENKNRLTSIRDLLKKKDVFDHIPLVDPEPAAPQEIMLAHSSEHYQAMKGIALNGKMVNGDTYYTEKTFETALLAAGGPLTLVKRGDSGFALVRPPGHHATRNSSMGFCIFNNAAIAALYARERLDKRVAIFDFDLHHGNGTQEILYETDILYISTHQWPHYPGTGIPEETGSDRGTGYNLNIPLPAGTADNSYLHALDELIVPIIKEHDPDLLILSAGYDSHYMDPLGSLRLSTKSYNEIGNSLAILPGSTIFTLEGGYDLSALPHSVYATLQGFHGLEPLEFDEPQSEPREVTEAVDRKIKECIRLMREFWSL